MQKRGIQEVFKGDADSSVFFPRRCSFVSAVFRLLPLICRRVALLPASSGRDASREEGEGGRGGEDEDEDGKDYMAEASNREAMVRK